MLEFAELMQFAKQMCKKLTCRQYLSALCCQSFFNNIIPNYVYQRAYQDAATLGYLSDALEAVNDDGLREYLNEQSDYGLLYGTKLIDFKHKVLCGMFLLTWSHYNNAVSSYWNEFFVVLCKEALGTSSPNDFESFDACLSALSSYCSYAYIKRNEPIFHLLNTQFGNSIQSDISIYRTDKYQYDTTLYGVYTGIISTIGF